MEGMRCSCVTHMPGATTLHGHIATTDVRAILNMPHFQQHTEDREKLLMAIQYTEHYTLQHKPNDSRGWNQTVHSIITTVVAKLEDEGICTAESMRAAMRAVEMELRMKDTPLAAQYTPAAGAGNPWKDAELQDILP